MANRIPLIVNPTAGQIQELPSGDTLLIGNDVDVNGSVDISTNLTLSNNTNSSTRLIVSSTTASTNSTSGSATFAGGVGISGALYVGGTINGTLANDIVTTDSINNDAVTYAKIQNVSATNKILGRDSDGAGVIEEISPANLRSMINVADGATNVTNNNQLTNGAGYLTASGVSVRRIKEAFSSAGAQSASNNAGLNYADYVSVTFDNVPSDSRFVIFASFQIRSSSADTNRKAEASVGQSGGGLSNNFLKSTNANTFTESNKFSYMEFDPNSNTNNRSYSIRFRSSHTNETAFIGNAAIVVVEFKV